MTLRLCLIGQGVAASPSPAMHNAALQALHIDGTYEVCDLDRQALREFASRMRGGAYQGCNVTIPHKAAMAALCDELEDDAAVLGITNTVVADQGGLRGANTDVAGFATALRQADLWPEPGGDAVVFGAGGAAAAVALALARVPVGRITVVARTPGTAAAMLARAAPGVSCAEAGWTRAEAAGALHTADIVVNATPVGLDGLPLDLTRLRRSCTVADVRYRPRPVDVVAAAAAAGLRSCDGAGMLLCQGMLSLRRWTDMEPPWDVARVALLEALDS
ncbi:MAG TPA: shikimate dehydrogenase [Candidatus Dormibacteraeota bacterium]